MLACKKLSKRDGKPMAAPATLTATTLEGQLLQMVEHVTNAQVMAILAAGANGATIKRIVTANVNDEIAGIKTVTLSIPISVETNNLGTGTTAAVVY